MIESAIATILKRDGIKKIIGSRFALSQLPQGTTYPALVFQVIDSFPVDPVDYTLGGKMRSRVQFNTFAKSLTAVIDAYTELISEMDYLHCQKIDSLYIISSRLAYIGPVDRDTETGLWAQPVDFSILYYRSMDHGS